MAWNLPLQLAQQLEIPVWNYPNISAGGIKWVYDTYGYFEPKISESSNLIKPCKWPTFQRNHQLSKQALRGKFDKMRDPLIFRNARPDPDKSPNSQIEIQITGVKVFWIFGISKSQKPNRPPPQPATSQFQKAKLVAGWGGGSWWVGWGFQKLKSQKSQIFLYKSQI